jgi:predicted RNA-binding Zn-ribbon protein involved in translation (DUF1610 family)
MIPERFMVTAKTKLNGELVTGYYCKTVIGDDAGFILDDAVQELVSDYELRRVNIDLSTLEPLAVPVITERHRMNQKGDSYDNLDIESYACPNCENVISQQRFNGETPVLGKAFKPDYCPDCGQRLNWDTTK